MASPYKKWVVPEVYPNISLRESGGNMREKQRQTFHLFWSHGKWGISGGWRLAINKVMMSVKGGGSGDPWITNSTGLITVWLTANTDVPSVSGRLTTGGGQHFCFFNKHVHATHETCRIKWVWTCSQVWPTIYLQWTWLCGLLLLLLVIY